MTDDVDANTRDAVAAALGEPLLAGGLVRLFVTEAEVPGGNGLAALGTALRWLWDRRAVTRAARLPRLFFLAVTDSRVAAVELRYERPVRVSAIPGVWSREEVSMISTDRSGVFEMSISDNSFEIEVLRDDNCLPCTVTGLLVR
ncbi:MAG: hypothetical protein U0Q03_00040 [Acidimicrobiales bacterium]